MSTETITFMGELWAVDFTYSPGTNYPIHSGSLEPNDPEELEVDSITDAQVALCQEFCDEFLEQNLDAIEDLVYEAIKT